MKHWIIDAGNTQTKLSEFRNNSWHATWIGEEAEKVAHEAADNGTWPDQALMSASGAWTTFWEQWPDLWRLAGRNEKDLVILEQGMDVGFPIDYTSPETVGMDRLANAAAVLAIDASVRWLIIDAGTCLTIDALEGGTWKGGSIAPGIDLRLKAMYAGTASLPYPEDWREQASNGLALHIGGDTVSSLLAGAIGGITAEIDGRIAAFCKHWPDFHVALTGGDAKFLELHDSMPIFADPNLTSIGYHQILQHVART